MKKVLVSLLMALSLVTSSTFTGMPSITVSAQAEEPLELSSDENEESSEEPSEDINAEEDQASTPDEENQNEETSNLEENKEDAEQTTISPEDSSEASSDPAQENTQPNEENTDSDDSSSESSEDANGENVPSDKEEDAVPSEALTPDTINADDESDYIIKTTEIKGMFYNVDAEGKLTIWGKNIKELPFSYDTRKKITSVVVSGSFSDCLDMFYGYTNATEIIFQNIDTSNVRCMAGMFGECNNLTALDLREFNTSRVSDMDNMFQFCDKLVSLNISSFNTSSVNSMAGMFWGCGSLTSLDVSRFDTSRVTEYGMYQMFRACSSLSSLDLSGFDTSKVISMEMMFYGCRSLQSLDISNFDTSKVTDMSHMFCACTNLSSLDVQSFDTSNVTDMSFMFDGCSNIESIDISNFNTSKVFNMHRMFSECPKLSNINFGDSIMLGAFDISYMFAECPALKTIGLSNFSTSKTTNMNGMFYNCTALESIDISSLDTTNVTEMSGMFSGCESLSSVNLVGIDTSKVQKFTKMFNNCKVLTSIDLSTFDTSSATDMQEMFANCTSLASLDLSSFDMSSVTNNKKMISKCSSLLEIITPINKGAIIITDDKFYLDDNRDGVADDNETTCRALGGIHTYIKYGYKPSAQQGNLPIAKVMVAAGSLIHKPEEGGTGTVILRIDREDFINTPSSTYNHEIAKFACGLSTMAYSKTTESIKQCFTDLGYATNKNLDLIYSQDKQGDTATYWIGNTPLDDDAILVTVLVRGTDGLEWLDNFMPGRNTLHEGFERGADTVLSGLSRYFETHNFTGKKIKLLVTGHSRGAAVANLIGYKLDKHPNNFEQIDFNDIFIYTFATPNVAHVEAYNRLTGYENIFNIVNPEDFVTKVLPSMWLYGRFGNTLVLPSSSNANSPDEYSRYLSNLRSDWKSYFKAGYSKTYRPYENGMEEISYYVTSVTDTVWNIDQYHDQYNGGTPATSLPNFPMYTLQHLYYMTLAQIMDGNKDDFTKGALSFASALKGNFGLIGQQTALFFLEHGKFDLDLKLFKMDSCFAYGHQSETYMAAMNTVSETELLRHKITMNVIINCPVDVKITDTKGTIVGEIVNNTEIQAKDGVSINVIGDSKKIIIPGNRDYNITLTGNDNGTMDFSLSEKDCDTLMGPRIFYQDVPITKDTAYEIEIAGSDDIRTYELTDENGNVIPKVDIPEGEIGKLTVETSVEGKGSAESFYNLTPGDYVILSAIPGENSEFEGWYDETGNRISTETEYGFSIEKSEKFTAKFVDKAEASTETPTKEDETAEKSSEQASNNTAEVAKNVETPSTNALPVGTEFTNAGKVYRISGDSTVTILKLEDKNAKTLSIPSSVVNEGTVYNVTCVNAKAFKGLKKLKTVTIPSSVESIGSKAFYNCKSLKKITIKSNKNLSVGKSAFKKVAKGCKITVKGLKGDNKKKIVEKIKKQASASVK